jgi:hypothetical protein
MLPSQAGGIWNVSDPAPSEYRHCVCGQQQPAAGSLISHNAVASALPIWVCLVRIMCIESQAYWPHKTKEALPQFLWSLLIIGNVDLYWLTRLVATRRFCDGLDGGNYSPCSKLLMRYRCSEQRQFLFHYFYSPFEPRDYQAHVTESHFAGALWFTSFEIVNYANNGDKR